MIQSLEAENKRLNESCAAMLKVITEDLPRAEAQAFDLRAENKQLRAAIDAIYQAEGDHAMCDCPVHRALFRVFAEYGV